MEAPNYWEQLSISSKKALQWAALMATMRAERANETYAWPVDVFDLFVGILLSHPDDSEAGILLEHFGLLPGQLLPDDYPQADEKELHRLMASIPAGEMPQLDTMTNEVVETAMRLGMGSGSPEVVELRALYVALLEVSSPLTERMDALISGRGASLSGLIRVNQNYLFGSVAVKEQAGSVTSKDYAELLNQELPYNPEPVRIPSYMADHGQQMNLSDDLVDIRAEVDAFAYLLASRGLKPPLAVGLFGDWGSGKSFFMDSVRSRIEQLVTNDDFLSQKQSEVPFWKRIIQIEFNAWHYVEGELWASLVEHIFNQLKLATDSAEDRSLVEDRKEFWTQQLENKLSRLVTLKEKVKQAETALRDKREELKNSREEYRQRLQELENLKNRKLQDIVLEDSIEEVKNALEPLMLSVGLPTPESISRQLREAREELTRGRVLMHYLQGEDRGRNTMKLALAILAVPVAVGVLSILDTTALVSTTGGLATAVASGLGILASVTGWARKHLDAIYAAEQRVAKDITDKRKEWQENIDEESSRLKEAKQKHDELVGRMEEAAKQVEDNKRMLEEVSAASLLNEFVEERQGSGDYRKRLGIPALIQQDFKKMSRLISEYNKECVADDMETGNEKGRKKKAGKKKSRNGKSAKEHYFNRIILYIDDLDRCPDERVVEVLQAVHLLLAFELFVVVVAVDSRWLNHALMKHYPALSAGRWDKNRASSEDYLEKIFQIPFWVRPLGDEARKNIVTGLLRDNVEHIELPGQEGKQELVLSLGEAEKGVLAQLNSRTPPPSMEAATLTISQEELAFLDQLSPLMGSTPRTVKRFVNLYQLVRIVYRTSTTGEEDNCLVPASHRLAFLLAIADGLPMLTKDLMVSLQTAPSEQTLGELSGQINKARYPQEFETFSRWLADTGSQGDFSVLKAEQFKTIIDIVSRFLFRTNGV